jgi:hypothetical protein
MRTVDSNERMDRTRTADSDENLHNSLLCGFEKGLAREVYLASFTQVLSSTVMVIARRSIGHLLGSKLMGLEHSTHNRYEGGRQMYFNRFKIHSKERKFK